MAHLPTNTFIVCDPCYVMIDELYEQMIDQFGWTGKTYHATVQGLEVVVLGTAYGDGRYQSNTNATFPVDAGIIGAIPVSLCDPGCVAQILKDGDGVLFENTELHIYEDNGQLSFHGNNLRLEIYTNEEEDENQYDEEYEDDY